MEPIHFSKSDQTSDFYGENVLGRTENFPAPVYCNMAKIYRNIGHHSWTDWQSNTSIFSWILSIFSAKFDLRKERLGQVDNLNHAIKSEFVTSLYLLFTQRREYNRRQWIKMLGCLIDDQQSVSINTDP